jgi:hypothetical protein
MARNGIAYRPPTATRHGRNAPARFPASPAGLADACRKVRPGRRMPAVRCSQDLPAWRVVSPRGNAQIAHSPCSGAGRSLDKVRGARVVVLAPFWAQPAQWNRARFGQRGRPGPCHLMLWVRPTRGGGHERMVVGTDRPCRLVRGCAGGGGAMVGSGSQALLTRAGNPRITGSGSPRLTGSGSPRRADAGDTSQTPGLVPEWAAGGVRPPRPGR